jgi:hypothetical protein
MDRQYGTIWSGVSPGDPERVAQLFPTIIDILIGTVHKGGNGVGT